MVERRSVRFTPEGQFEEYDKSVLLIKNGKPLGHAYFEN